MRWSARISFVSGVRAFAMKFLHGPFRVVADPLGDIGLRGHDALPERTVPRKLKVLVLTLVRLRDCADQKDDFQEVHGEISALGTL